MAQYNDSLYGSVNLSPIQRDLADSDPVLKTGDIRTLGLCKYVFKSASHTREEHMHGTSILLSKFSEKLGFDPTAKKTLEAAGILHDIGHFAFSHSAQKYFAKYDLVHEEFARDLILNQEGEIYHVLQDHGVNPFLVAALIYDDSFVANGHHRFEYMKQLVAGTMDCDRLDFLKRDALRTAKHALGVDHDRIMQCANFDGERIVYSEEARSAICEFFGSYHNMYTSVYFNPKVNSLEKMLNVALHNKDDIIVNGYKSLDEKRDFLYQLSEQELQRILCSDEKDHTKRHAVATRLARRLFRGDAFTNAFALTMDDACIGEYGILKRRLNDASVAATIENAIKTETDLEDGDFIVIDNHSEKEAKCDVYFNLDGQIVKADEFLDLTSFDVNKRHRHVLRVVSDEKHHEQIDKVVRRLFN